MQRYLVKPVRRLSGKIVLAGDKSIAHRAVILAAISNGKTAIKNFPVNLDCDATVEAFKKLGIRFEHPRKDILSVYGKGLFGLKKPKSPFFIAESGTTLRLLMGLLSGHDFKVTLNAGKFLSRRPMLRVTAPLRLMGAQIMAQAKTSGIKHEEYPPIIIQGGQLKAIYYKMPIASAQVKSAILLAGLYAQGKTQITELVKTRDHTERILKMFGAEIHQIKNRIMINGQKELNSPGSLYIPGDISSASFFIVAGALLNDSKISIKKVSLNPGRIGAIKVLQRMGADIKIKVPGVGAKEYEPIGDLVIKASPLRGTIVTKKEIPSLIDELPVVMVAASYAQGETVFQGVEELRVKETDRINSMCLNLKKMGAKIKVMKKNNREDIVIFGVRELRGAKVSSFNDHRTAMSMVVAGLKATGLTEIDDITCINKSFPGFLDFLNTLSAEF